MGVYERKIDIHAWFSYLIHRYQDFVFTVKYIAGTV